MTDTKKFIFDTVSQAEEVLKQMKEIEERYNIVFLSDLYELVGLNAPYPTNKQELKNIDKAVIIKVKHGYAIEIPEKIISKAITGDVAKKDMVNHPDHYISETGLEVIDVIEAFTSDLSGIEATDTGNIIKYACRWNQKNGVEDLKKIVWYANHLINHIEKLEKENK